MPDMPQTKNQYISLQEATKLSSYSQEYLSLRARQGKLRAIKIGRNWATTQEWLDEYIAKAEAVKETYKNGSGKKKEAYLQAKIVAPPVNLPVEQEEAFVFTKPKRPSLFPSLKVGFVVSTILLFVFGGAVYGKDGVYEFAGDVHEAVQTLSDNAQQAVVVAGAAVHERVQHLGTEVKEDVASIAAALPDSIDGLSEGFDQGAPVALNHARIGVGEFGGGLKTGIYQPRVFATEAVEYLVQTSPRTFVSINDSIKQGILGGE